MILFVREANVGSSLNGEEKKLWEPTQVLADSHDRQAAYVIAGHALGP